jgi:polar amino acid transport system substrate-binding protein
MKVLLALLLTLIGTAANALEPLVIGFDVSSPPTMYDAGDGEAAGIYPAIVRRAFERMGQPVRLVPLPLRRMMGSLQNGTIGGGALIATSERQAYCDYSAPYFVEQLAVYSMIGKNLPFHSLADLAGRKVGLIRAWAYGADFDTARAAKLFEVEEVDSDDQNFQKLKFGRIDMAVATRLAGDILVADNKYAGIGAYDTQLTATPIHLVFNKKNGNADLLRRFDDAIRAMQAAGEIQAIVAREQRKAAPHMDLRSGQSK